MVSYNLYVSKFFFPLLYSCIISGGPQCCLLCDQRPNRTELREESSGHPGIPHSQVYLQIRFLRYQRVMTSYFFYRLIPSQYVKACPGSCSVLVACYKVL
uniref:Uncharacterized protein n=1 Tax=Anguilla anguilla TaxID=7936 RepID=A0A0E9VC04_ANGAN